MKKRGKYYKQTLYGLLYGASLTMIARKYHLGLRRTHILHKQLINKEITRIQ